MLAIQRREEKPPRASLHAKGGRSRPGTEGKAWAEVAKTYGKNQPSVCEVALFINETLSWVCGSVYEKTWHMFRVWLYTVSGSTGGLGTHPSWIKADCCVFL